MGEPRSLTDAELAAWRSFAEVVVRLPSILETELRRDSAMTHFEYVVLVALTEADGELRLGHLAAMVNASLPRISQVADRMAQRGWVHRKPCLEDSRAVLVVLTDDGRAKLRAAAPGHLATVRRIFFDALNAEMVGDAARLSDALLRNLDETE